MIVKFIRKDRRIYPDAHCLHCGDFYGVCLGERRVHPPSICKACGTPQCWTNGLARGTCGVCYVGLLDKFSGHNKPCGYAHCGKEAVALAPRVGRVCRDHLKRAHGDRIEQYIKERDAAWERIEYDPSTFPVLELRKENA